MYPKGLNDYFGPNSVHAGSATGLREDSRISLHAARCLSLLSYGAACSSVFNCRYILLKRIKVPCLLKMTSKRRNGACCRLLETLSTTNYSRFALIHYSTPQLEAIPCPVPIASLYHPFSMSSEGSVNVKLGPAAGSMSLIAAKPLGDGAAI